MLSVERRSQPVPGSISFIVPTVGRASLQRTIDSILMLPGDEILIVQGHPPYQNWGATERHAGMVKATGEWLAFIDDDDVYAPDARRVQASGIEHAERLGIRAPIIFRMQYKDTGLILWRDGEPELAPGNVGTPMAVVPNDPPKLGRWTERQWGDYDFLEGSFWPRRKFIFRPEVIAFIEKTPLNPYAARALAQG